MSLEVVLLVPVLVLMTVFVLWAGRGGRAALTADLAAEEAATAAALCCEEDLAGAEDREALVEDMLEARPGLGFLCIGGPRPNAPADGGVGPDEFLSEHWLKFQPGRDTGGVGVLGVQFLCESDGAVAPLRGLFPTVTFHGQASEVVLREPRFIAGFDPTRVDVKEGRDDELMFTIVVEPAVGELVTLAYELDWVATTAEPEDFGGTDFADLLGLDSSGVGTVEIPAGALSVHIRLPLVDDDFFEDEELLVLTLTGVAPSSVDIEDRIEAIGAIEEDDPQPFLQIIKPYPEVPEGGVPGTTDSEYLIFDVRLGDSDGTEVDDIAEQVEVRVSTVADPAAQGEVCSDWVGQGEPCSWATAGADYQPVVATALTFEPGDNSFTQPVQVMTLDDFSGERTEVVLVELSGESGAAVRQGYRIAGGKILDDEAKVSSILDVTLPTATEGDPVVFEVTLDREPAADVTLDYTLGPDNRLGAHGATQAAGSSCTDGDDYVGATGQVIIAAFSQQKTFEVQTCEDLLVEHDETFWVELSRSSGEVDVPAGTGAWGTIRDDDIPVVSVSPAAAEGTEGQPGPLAFTVSLTVGGLPAQLTEEVTVDYEFGGVGTEPATAPGEPNPDYAVTLAGTALSGSTLQGTLAFTVAAPGTSAVTEHLFEVEPLADHLLEDPETFQLDLDSLSDPAVFEDRDGDANTDDSYAVGTILDDPPPVLSVDGFSGLEGTQQSFTVSLSGARAGDDVTVDYDIVGDSGTDPATAIDDFRAPPPDPPDLLSGTLTFTAGGAAEIEVPVELVGDYLPENPETLRLTLTNPSGAVLFGSDPGNSLSQIHGVGTITDVLPPTLSVVGFERPLEGTTQSFTVTLGQPPLGRYGGGGLRLRARLARCG